MTEQDKQRLADYFGFDINDSKEKIQEKINAAKEKIQHKNVSKYDERTKLEWSKIEQVESIFLEQPSTIQTEEEENWILKGSNYFTKTKEKFQPTLTQLIPLGIKQYLFRLYKGIISKIKVISVRILAFSPFPKTSRKTALRITLAIIFGLLILIWIPKNSPNNSDQSFSLKNKLIQNLFNNCTNTQLWRDSLKSSLNSEKTAFIVQGKFDRRNLGNVNDFLGIDNVCEFYFKRFEVGDTIILGYSSLEFERQLSLKELFENCETTPAWKNQLEKLTGESPTDVIIGGAYRTGNLSEFLRFENICEYAFTQFYTAKTNDLSINQLYLELKNPDHSNFSNCLNEESIGKIAKYIIQLFYTYTRIMGDTSYGTKRRLRNKEKAMNLFIDKNRRVGFRRCKNCPEEHKIVPVYFDEELLDTNNLKDFSSIQMELEDYQEFKIENIRRQSDGDYHGSVTILQNYKKVKMEPLKGGEFRELLLYKDFTIKQFEITVTFHDCFDSSGLYVKDGCCTVLLGDIKAIQIIDK